VPEIERHTNSTKRQLHQLTLKRIQPMTNKGMFSMHFFPHKNYHLKNIKLMKNERKLEKGATLKEGKGFPR